MNLFILKAANAEHTPFRRKIAFSNCFQGTSSDPTMFAVVNAPAYNVGMRAPVVQRAVAPSMFDISAHDDIWGLPAKEDVFAAWDPSKPRDYNNFNPFERNDESQQCDKNGCFPGQDNGYMPPNRPDVSWAIQQAQNKRMDELKADPKFSISGQPGNWKK